MTVPASGFRWNKGTLPRQQVAEPLPEALPEPAPAAPRRRGGSRGPAATATAAVTDVAEAAVRQAVRRGTKKAITSGAATAVLGATPAGIITRVGAPIVLPAVGGLAAGLVGAFALATFIGGATNNENMTDRVATSWGVNLAVGTMMALPAMSALTPGRSLGGRLGLAGLSVGAAGGLAVRNFLNDFELPFIGKPFAGKGAGEADIVINDEDYKPGAKKATGDDGGGLLGLPNVVVNGQEKQRGTLRKGSDD